MKQSILLYCLFFSLWVSGVHSQSPKVFTLQECIDKAIANNIQSKQDRIKVQESQSKLSATQYSRLPTVNGSLSQNFATGRIIDPFTNIITNQNTNYQNWGISSSVLLYNGGQFQSNLKSNQLEIKLSQQGLSLTEENLKLRVIELFFKVLNAKEQLESVVKQFENSKVQYRRFEVLSKEGVASKSAMLDLQAQMAGEELGIANAESALDYAKTELLQVLNDGSTKIEIDSKPFSQLKIEEYKYPLSSIIQQATNGQPGANMARTNIEISKMNAELAQLSNRPSLFANLNIGTNFSSAAPPQQFISDGKPSTVVEVKSSDYVLVNGQKQNVVRLNEVPSGRIRQLGYFGQLGYNLSGIIGVSLRVPIFNAFETKIRTQQANLNRLRAENELLLTQQQIKNTIELAFKNMQAAYKQYQLTARQLSVLEAAFDLTKKRFEEGNMNSLEYTISKNNIDKVRIDLIQAKYNYIFRTKILDFYADRI